MAILNEDYTKTLPYFLTHGTRSNELCFVICRDKLKCVIYIDNNDQFIDTIPQELWDATVTKHYYEALTLSQCYGHGEVKSISNIQVHYIIISR